MSYDLKTLRDALAKHAVEQELSLRNIEELVGVSFATLSRFLRGSDLSAQSARRISAYLSGEPLDKIEPIVVKRFKVGGKVFIVEIRQVE